MNSATSPPLSENHSPTSSSSMSDKENNGNLIASQRVRSIVNEFNKLADESNALSNRTYTNLTNTGMFQRQGFRNASMHTVPTRPPTSSFAPQKASSGSFTSLLIENYRSKPGRLDRITALQAACAEKDAETEIDLEDLFALKTQRIRLQNRFEDLSKMRREVASAIGEKRSAIIDKKVRQCINEADLKLDKMREKINHLGTQIEKHQHFERLYEDLDKWTGDLVHSLGKLNVEDNSIIHSLQMGLQNERANFEELRTLSEFLGKGQRKQFESVEEKWSQLENTLNSLKIKIERQNANERLTEAIEKLNQLLGDTPDLNTSAQIRNQLDRIDELEVLCQESTDNPCVKGLKKDVSEDSGVWKEPSTPIQTKQTSIYDECTQSISTSPSSEHSIPISSFTTSKTQIHGEPVELQAFLNSLQNYNLIRFSAYRTGMKLFAVQKRLCLDLVEISELVNEFRSLPAGIPQIPWESLFTVLRRVYEKAHFDYPRSVPDVQIAIHRCAELLRQLSPNFDTRTVMLILTVLCNGKLDDKYRYLFIVYATGVDDTATAEDLRLMFTDLAKIPALLHEERAFGVANVESTIRSCLRASTTSSHALSNTPNLTCIYPTAMRVLPSSIDAHVNRVSNAMNSIKINDFWRWIRQDPQTLVWIRVMHRLVRSEFAKHNARCAGCKMTPIVGIRFRCLHCFNVDLCQNCFFTQKDIKGHKIKHEMHEYYMPTSTLDNVRDFTQIVHNKMRRTKSTNKIGYTPIDFNVTDHQTASTLPSKLSENKSEPIEVNVDAVIDQARREGRLPPPMPPQRRQTPMTRWPNLNEQKPAALTPTASPEDLNRLIAELQRENDALKQAVYRRNNNPQNGMKLPDTISQESILRRFDASNKELAEAMSCLVAVSSTPTEV